MRPADPHHRPRHHLLRNRLLRNRLLRNHLLRSPLRIRLLRIRLLRVRLLRIQLLRIQLPRIQLLRSQLLWSRLFLRILPHHPQRSQLPSREYLPLRRSLPDRSDLPGRNRFPLLPVQRVPTLPQRFPHLPDPVRKQLPHNLRRSLLRRFRQSRLLPGSRLRSSNPKIPVFPGTLKRSLSVHHCRNPHRYQNRHHCRNKRLSLLPHRGGPRRRHLRSRTRPLLPLLRSHQTGRILPLREIFCANFCFLRL